MTSQQTTPEDTPPASEPTRLYEMTTDELHAYRVRRWELTLEQLGEQAATNARKLAMLAAWGADPPPAA